MNLWSGHARGVLVALWVTAAAIGCGDTKRAGVAAGETTVGADSMGAAPTGVATVAIRTRRNLRESSALALSANQTGVVYTINDSGNEPILFALDTTGADRGAWRVKQSTNVDWEALAIGACGTRSASCVYIGDVGDNDAKHPSRTIYRVREPDPMDSSFTGTMRAEHVTFVYPDRPHDVEALYIAPNGDAFLITKRPERTLRRRLRPALVFRLSSHVWSSKKAVVAELIDSLSIVPGSAPLRTITDASLSPDARRLAVRTYTQLFVYATDPATGRVNTAVAPSICNLAPLGEPQGEGVTWVSSTGRFAFSSEGRGVPLHLATCPVPP